MIEISILLTKLAFGWVTSGRSTVKCGNSPPQLLFVFSQTQSQPTQKSLLGLRTQDSPLLPVSAKQQPDALVQRGPAGLVSQESQEIRAEGGHLGPCLQEPNEEEMQ